MHPLTLLFGSVDASTDPKMGSSCRLSTDCIPQDDENNDDDKNNDNDDDADNNNNDNDNHDDYEPGAEDQNYF